MTDKGRWVPHYRLTRRNWRMREYDGVSAVQSYMMDKTDTPVRISVGFLPSGRYQALLAHPRDFSLMLTSHDMRSNEIYSSWVGRHKKEGKMLSIDHLTKCDGMATKLRRLIVDHSMVCPLVDMRYVNQDIVYAVNKVSSNSAYSKHACAVCHIPDVAGDYNPKRPTRTVRMYGGPQFMLPKICLKCEETVRKRCMNRGFIFQDGCNALNLLMELYEERRAVRIASKLSGSKRWKLEPTPRDHHEYPGFHFQHELI